MKNRDNAIALIFGSTLVGLIFGNIGYLARAQFSNTMDLRIASVLLSLFLLVFFSFLYWVHHEPSPEKKEVLDE